MSELLIKHYQNPVTGKITKNRNQSTVQVVAEYDNGGVKTASGDVYYNVRKVGERKWETTAM